MIVIDIHEPYDLVELLKKRGAQVKVKKLDVADYVIGNIGVERKSFQDFFRSIIDKRIFSQLERMKEAYEKHILILEGDLQTALYTISNPNVILGEIISIILDMNIGIIYSRDKEETVNILYMIWRRIRREKRETVLRYKPKIMSKKERLLFILEGFPGIGDKLAENILNHYGTIRNFATTSLSELMDIEGIGEKKAKDIIEILTLDYRKLKRMRRLEG